MKAVTLVKFQFFKIIHKYIVADLFSFFFMKFASKNKIFPTQLRIGRQNQ